MMHCDDLDDDLDDDGDGEWVHSSYLYWKYISKPLTGKVCLGSRFWVTESIMLGGMAAGAEGSSSPCLHGQEAERGMSLLGSFLLFVASATPAHRMVLASLTSVIAV